MAHKELTIENLFVALQKEFGPFPDDALQSGGLFEDMPATVLEAELAQDARFEDLPGTVREATAQSTASLAA